MTANKYKYANAVTAAIYKQNKLRKKRKVRPQKTHLPNQKKFKKKIQNTWGKTHVW